MRSDTLKSKVVVICGPTAMGKTAVAVDLAETFAAEIISADSMQIYRYMDIGTAKPTVEEQAAVAHHMIDIVDPDESFDAKQFAEMARKKIKKLHRRKIAPIVVGGTGLYIKALLSGLSEAAPADLDIRARLKEEAKDRGTECLHNRLGRLDPVSAERLHPNDTYRILRALEVFELTGKRLSDYHNDHKFADKPFSVMKIGLDMPRDLLYDRINRRVDTMIESGLFDEVKKLLEMGCSENLKSMQSIGYRHMVDFIQRRSSWHEMLNTLKRDTRRYAKRQLTWFKADSDIEWSTPDRADDIRRTIKKFLQGR